MICSRDAAAQSCRLLRSKLTLKNISPQKCVLVYNQCLATQTWEKSDPCCVVWCGCSRGDSCPGGRTEWLMIHSHRWSQFAPAPGERAVYGGCCGNLSNINWMMWNLTFANDRNIEKKLFVSMCQNGLKWSWKIIKSTFLLALEGYFAIICTTIKDSNSFV